MTRLVKRVKPAVAQEAARANVAGKTIGMTLRLTSETHDQLRTIAFKRRKTIASLLHEGVAEAITKYKSDLS